MKDIFDEWFSSILEDLGFDVKIMDQLKYVVLMLLFVPFGFIHQCFKNRYVRLILPTVVAYIGFYFMYDWIYTLVFVAWIVA